MKKIIWILLCISFFSFSEGFEKFEFKENVVLPRTEIISHKMLGATKIYTVLGLELTNNIYLAATGEIRIDIYGFAGRKLNKNIKMSDLQGNYSYIVGNNLVFETNKKIEKIQINLDQMKLASMKIERKGPKLEESVFPIVYETIEKINENEYKLSSYMKKGFSAKKLDNKTIEIYYGNKLENTIKLEDNILNIYDKTGILEASVSETEDSIKITDSKKSTEIKVNNQTIEVFENNKKKSIASYNIVAM